MPFRENKGAQLCAPFRSVLFVLDLAPDEAAQNAIVRNVITEKVLERIWESAEIETVEKEQ